ncbi:hypothetical protein D3C79_653130 [compost metagenome]
MGVGFGNQVLGVAKDFFRFWSIGSYQTGIAFTEGSNRPEAVVEMLRVALCNITCSGYRLMLDCSET